MNVSPRFSLLYAVFLLPSAPILAAMNPIHYDLKQNFPATVIVEGGTYLAAYTFRNDIPMTMVNPLSIEKTTNSPSEFSFNDGCSGLRLAYRQECSVNITLNPSSTGTKTVQLTEAYGHDRVPVPLLSTISNSNSGGTNVTGITSTELPGTMAINETKPWAFTYTNNGDNPATGLSLSVTGTSSYSTNNCTTLGTTYPSNTCTVSGNFKATSAESTTISSTLYYAQGASVYLFTSTNSSDSNEGLVCTPQVGFAPQTLISSTVNPITLLCTNKSNNILTITGHTPSYPTGGAQGTFTVASGGDNCTNQDLGYNPPASCQLSGSYQAPSSAVSSVTVSLSVNYVKKNTQTPTYSASTHTSTDIVNTINNQRTINLINNCNFDVWWGMVSGAAKHLGSCSVDADCAGGNGASCDTSNNTCYYNTTWPSTGGTSGNPFHLTKNGGAGSTASTTISQTSASGGSGDILWSGLISASTQCSNGTCQNNPCGNSGGSTSCPPGTGFNQPATEAEFTFLLNGSGNLDVYDISNVNGFSMPISMSTNKATTYGGYSCGTAGDTATQAYGSPGVNLGASNYSSVTPPTPMYYWVTTSSHTCTTQSDCSSYSGTTCGLSYDGTSFASSCGDYLGFWAANEICQTNGGFTSPFGDGFTCSQYLGSPFPENTYTLTQLLKCSPPDSTAPLFNSCYSTYPVGTSSTALTRCCGCTDWSGITTPATTCPSGQTDPQWTTQVWSSNVEGIIKWQKQACPTCYSYTYDDEASTFKCEAASDTDYTITFCPGGASQTGLPAGATDGRG